MSRRNALGKGLDALLPSDMKEDLGQEDRLKSIPVDEIHPAESQPRKEIDEQALEELANSIAEQGLLQPIIVTPVDDEYKIIVGERRWRASRKAGLENIPTLVLKELSEEKRLFLSVVENVQREDLNPLEEGRAYKQLQQRFDLTQDQIAERVGKSRSTVANIMRILELPPDVKELLKKGDLTTGHARALLSMEDPEAMIKLANLVVKKNISVRRTEILAQTVEKSSEEAEDKEKKQKEKRRSPKIVALEDQFKDLLGTNVKISPKKKKGGKIIIEYYDKEDLKRISSMFNE